MASQDKFLLARQYIVFSIFIRIFLFSPFFWKFWNEVCHHHSLWSFEAYQQLCDDMGKHGAIQICLKSFSN